MAGEGEEREEKRRRVDLILGEERECGWKGLAGALALALAMARVVVVVVVMLEMVLVCGVECLALAVSRSGSSAWRQNQSLILDS